MIDKAQALDAIELYRLALGRGGITARQIVLFGSFAAGQEHPGSDIDIVVISEDFIGKDHESRIAALSDAVVQVMVPIEAVAATPDEWDHQASEVLGWARDGETVFPAAVE